MRPLYLFFLTFVMITAVFFSAQAQESYFTQAYKTPSVKRLYNVQRINGAEANIPTMPVNPYSAPQVSAPYGHYNSYRPNARYGEHPLNRGGLLGDGSGIHSPGGYVQDFAPHSGALGFHAPPFSKTIPSPIEQMYSERIVEELTQYGYDIFQSDISTVPALYDEDGKKQSNIPSGAVQDDFVLNTGDELDITIGGQKTTREIYRVGSDGSLIVEDFPPVPAAGRTIGQVRATLELAARSQYNTEIYVSLASVRQIGVLLAGHVRRPGRQTLTVFHTVLDALSEAGGITKTGSLRQIKLVRGGRTMLIDLYGLMMHGNTAMDLNLRDGDRIVIPPLGPTVAVAGEVKRPGIYELLPRMQGMFHEPEKKSAKVSLNQMLELGGGVLAPGKNRFLKLAINHLGQEDVDDVRDGFANQFGDGSILMVSKGQERRSGTVELVGHTRRPGIHALGKNTSLAALLNSEDVVGPSVYPLIGVIERWDRVQLSKTLIDFPLGLVLKGQYDLKLQDGDVVHLFSHEQIDNLSTDIITPPDEIETLSRRAELELGSRYDGAFEEYDEQQIEDPMIVSYLEERASFVRGAIRKPGAYPVSQDATLDQVLAVAGGLALEANTNNIELTSASNTPGFKGQRRTTTRTRIDLGEAKPAEIIVSPGDAVRVNQRFEKIKDQSVLLVGEVRNPGRYDLVPGDKVSDLINRAGGLTRDAYPAGAIFSRESERKAEEARFKGHARAIKAGIARALETDDQKIDAGKIAEARALAEELQHAEALGRITVEIDPGVLAVEPELDMLLEEGDRIYVPKRSLMVRVNGEVLSPASLQFREGKSPIDYVHEAGGFTFHADKDRTFVLYPDGSAQPLEIGMWNYNPVFVPPGSTIVVPRDPEPFDFIQSAKDISQILSNLAVTAIFIDDVVDDDF